MQSFNIKDGSKVFISHPNILYRGKRITITVIAENEKLISLVAEGQDQGFYGGAQLAEIQKIYLEKMFERDMAEHRQQRPQGFIWMILASAAILLSLIFGLGFYFNYINNNKSVLTSEEK